MNDPHQKYQIADAPGHFQLGFGAEENKENDDQWFNDFFAEPEKEKQREERKAAQEQGRNAMQARLKAQKQALEARVHGGFGTVEMSSEVYVLLRC